MASPDSNPRKEDNLSPATEPTPEPPNTPSSVGFPLDDSGPTIGTSQSPTRITIDANLGLTSGFDLGSPGNDPSFTPAGWEPQVVEDSLGASHGEPSGTVEEDSTLDLSLTVLKDKVNATFQSDLSADISALRADGDGSLEAGSDAAQSSPFSSSSLDQTSSTALSNSDTTSTALSNSDTTSAPPSGSSSVLPSSEFPSASSSEVSPSFLTSAGSPPSLLTPSMNSFQRDSSEPVGDSDEEYFEEFHLPNTHENAFVRHLSFRRKVQTTPIHAPDAERIEGLVRTGEFVRHGSIRKKIVPEETLPQHEEEEEEEGTDEEGEGSKSSSFSQRIERDIREIERYLSEENGDVSFNENDSLSEQLPRRTPSKVKMKQTTSTPKAPSEAGPGEEEGPSPSRPHEEESESRLEDSQPFEESRIEESTLRKIQDCLDFSSYKDLLNLSGRLSDLLSPKEVEEVLHNSERYRQYLDSEVFEALSLSFRGQTQSLPCNINAEVSPSVKPKTLPETNSNSNSTKSIPNTDSGFSSPKSPKEEKGDGEGDLQLVRRNSVPIEGIGAEGIFLETPSTGDLKRIRAPEVNLDSSSDTRQDGSDAGHMDISDNEAGFEAEEEDEEGDGKEEEEEGGVEGEEATPPPPRKKITVEKGILNAIEDCGFAFEEGAPVGVGAKEELRQEEEERFTVGVTGDTTSADIPEDLSTPLPEQFPAPPPPDLIPELTSAEELSEVRHWRNVVIGGAWRRIDMKVIAQYRKCISHGGYMEQSQSPIVVLSAALLPEKTRKDYHYVMDNLFMYVLSFLEQLVADDYVLVYFSGGAQNGSGPGFHWMRRAYEMIDRRLRKNLKSLLVVHPSMWARTIVTLSRPFISAKFYRKLNFVPHLTDLASLVPLEQLEIPDAVKQADFQIMIKEKKKMNGRRKR